MVRTVLFALFSRPWTRQPMKQMISTLKTTVNRPYEMSALWTPVGETLVTHTGYMVEVSFMLTLFRTWQTPNDVSSGSDVLLQGRTLSLGCYELMVEMKKSMVVVMSECPCFRCEVSRFDSVLLTM